MDKTILIVEDDETQRVLLEAFIKNHLDLKCYKAENGQKAIQILKKHHLKIDLIITDLQMPVMDGIELLENIQDVYAHIPVIVMSASQDIQDAVKAMTLGANNYITKPYDKDRLPVTIKNALRMRQMVTEIQRLNHDHDNRFLFTDMIGYHGGLRHCIKMGRRAAMIDLPVLIYGETGTGKELFAKAIHGEGKRSGAPFITVNCGAIPSELVESTLFGHEKGAFTGATESAIGKFREADGGTLLLDEIGDLPPEAQVKLLRVLQEGEVEPVGAARSVKVNVRILAATHRNLEQDVQNGLFREDLFYRLNVLHLTLPSLRDRREDITELSQFFLDKIAVQSNMPIKSIDQSAKTALKNHDWPGNVRELENTIYRAFALSDATQLMIDDFHLSTKPIQKSIHQMEDKTNTYGLKTIDEMIDNHILNTLAHHNNNITKTAQTLGMAKSTLYRKLKNAKK